MEALRASWLRPSRPISSSRSGHAIICQQNPPFGNPGGNLSATHQRKVFWCSILHSSRTFLKRDPKNLNNPSPLKFSLNFNLEFCSKRSKCEQPFSPATSEVWNVGTLFSNGRSHFLWNEITKENSKGHNQTDFLVKHLNKNGKHLEKYIQGWPPLPPAIKFLFALSQWRPGIILHRRSECACAQFKVIYNPKSLRR